MRIHWRSPVRSSPCPVAPADGTKALGLLPQASHPGQAGPAQRTSRRGSTLNTGRGLPVWHSQPPIERLTHIRDFASHNTRSTTGTKAKLVATIDKWVRFYNSVRRHAAIGMLSPDAYERSLRVAA